MDALKKTIQVGVASALIAAGVFSGTLAHAGQQQTSEVPKIIRKSGGALQASAIKRVEPSYPLLAKAAHVSGAVLVELTIDESGDVSSAKAISGHPLLKDAAVQAALGWFRSGGPARWLGRRGFWPAGEPLSQYAGRPCRPACW